MGTSNFATGPLSYFAIIMVPYRVQPSRCEKPHGHWCSTSSDSSCDRWSLARSRFNDSIAPRTLPSSHPRRRLDRVTHRVLHRPDGLNVRFFRRRLLNCGRSRPGMALVVQAGIVISRPIAWPISIRVRKASGRVMNSQLNVKRPTCSGATAIRVKVECLRCGHCGVLDETDLPRFGVESGAPIATFVKRLTCRECGSHSVRAFRSDR